MVAGEVAGRRRPHDRRLKIRIDDREYYGSRLAWLYMTGAWPVAEVDHRDLDKSNDRWANLREADHGQNQANGPRRRHNRVGVKGVIFDGRSKRNPYVAYITINKKKKNLGGFATAEAAHAAYCAAARDAKGEFSRGA